MFEEINGLDLLFPTAAAFEALVGVSALLPPVASISRTSFLKPDFIPRLTVATVTAVSSPEVTILAIEGRPNGESTAWLCWLRLAAEEGKDEFAGNEPAAVGVRGAFDAAVALRASCCCVCC